MGELDEFLTFRILPVQVTTVESKSRLQNYKVHIRQLASCAREKSY